MEIETSVLLAYAMEDSTDVFRISGGGWGVEHPKPPLGTPLIIMENCSAAHT